MNKTLICPKVWNKFGIAQGGSNPEIRLGWREFNFTDYKYNSWVKFDVTELLALNLRVRHIVSAKIVLRLTTTSSYVSCRVHNTLKPATSDANWNTYNGTNYWSAPGGEGAGSDIGSELTTHSSFSQTTVEIPLSGVALMEAAVASNGIFSLITSNSQTKNEYIVAYNSTYPPFLSVVYNKPSTYDVIIF